MRATILTTLALVAFAANSILCRAALGAGRIDAASFATVRLLSGAIALTLIAPVFGRPLGRPRGSWSSALLLVLYAVPFAFAYNSLTAGTGALILFGAVQATMLAAGLATGERPGSFQWLGLTLAAAGMVYLVLPGLGAPNPAGVALMATAGVAWGLYSLRGRRAGDPLAETTGNFVRSSPFVVLLPLVARSSFHVSAAGLALALASGALASGVFYAIWYAALRNLTATLAATVQLSVPILAATGGVLLMAEPVGLRLVISAVLVLGGIAMATLAARRSSSRPLAPATGFAPCEPDLRPEG